MESAVELVCAPVSRCGLWPGLNSLRIDVPNGVRAWMILSFRVLHKLLASLKK
jgi:hypothetical protein